MDFQEVPSPWTDVIAEMNEQGADVSVWGRIYRFANSALPTQISTGG